MVESVDGLRRRIDVRRRHAVGVLDTSDAGALVRRKARNGLPRYWSVLGAGHILELDQKRCYKRQDITAAAAHFVELPY